MKIRMRDMIFRNTSLLISFVFFFLYVDSNAQSTPSSAYITVQSDGHLQYKPDDRGNIMPDFSRVGYHHGDRSIPKVEVVVEVFPSDDDQRNIQAAIDRVSKRVSNAQAFRGTVLLAPGTYRIPGTLRIDSSGVVLRGSGNATQLVATGTLRRSLIRVSGTGTPQEVRGTRQAVTDRFIPTGRYDMEVMDAGSFRPGDEVIVEVQANDRWVKALKMDRIEERPGTVQWNASGFRFSFQRRIVSMVGKRILLDNPVMMELDSRYLEVSVFRYRFPGRISEVGVEDISCISEYRSDTAEDHGWIAVEIDRVENAWVRNVHAVHFGLGCVSLQGLAKNITVSDCSAVDPKSIITGGRRYSFNINGQQNLVIRCHSREARHDFATGSRVCGPNVFSDCSAERSYSDIGPHHRWTMGTLYDNIRSDNQINVQDRGNWGSGHGWAGVTQVLWNCTAATIACQDPWIGGRNYLIGGSYRREAGRLPNRTQTLAEGQGVAGLSPGSLYLAQYIDRLGVSPGR